jgi:hypothetical protein
MSRCENLDGQCAQSWCNCDDVRKRRAQGSFAAPAGSAPVVRVGEELSKAMRIHDYNRSRKLLPAREGWTVVDNDYMGKHAPDLRWFCGGGWWDLPGAFVFASLEEAEQYAQSFRGKKPDVEYWQCPAQNDQRERREAAAADVQIATERNGCLPFARRFGSAM